MTSVIIGNGRSQLDESERPSEEEGVRRRPVSWRMAQLLDRLWATRSVFWTTVLVIVALAYALLAWFVLERPSALGAMRGWPWYAVIAPGLIVGVTALLTHLRELVSESLT